jgi:CheY-like chemotaxis protein
LVGNAVKFTETGFIKIIAENAKTNDDGSLKLIIKVQDSGIGINPNNQQEIFDAFRQQENQNTRKYGGTGLGLSITKRLVEILGGEIELKSKLGEGSTFSVIFDNISVSQEHIENTELSKDKKEEYLFNQEIVLIVDDVPGNRFLLKSYLSGLNLILVEAENGQEAVELAKIQKPDVILMDLRMPVMNGIDATRKIKQISSLEKVPIVAVTASSMHFEDQDIIDAGFNGFLDKPVSRTQILNELVKYIEPKERINAQLLGVKDNALVFNHIDDKYEEIIKLKLCELVKETQESGNMNDVLSLAEQIKVVGEQYSIETFTQISEKLFVAGKSFDIEAIQKILVALNRHCI